MIRSILMVTALALLVGCASKPTPPAVPEPASQPDRQPAPRAEPRSESGNRSPYRVHGRTYRVLPSSMGYRAEGVASWYGPNFDGRPTSSGETFDMHQFTAAHRSLPLPTYARVTNLDNGLSVTVRINDRGPFKDNRIIDLSFAAARAIDMIQAGTTLVEVVALEPEQGAALPLVVETSGIFLQLGAFSDRDNAIALLNRLRREGIERAHIFTTPAIDDQFIHRVRIGPFESAESADTLAARLVLLGMDRPRTIFE